jgi:hypothetical protein
MECLMTYWKIHGSSSPPFRLDVTTHYIDRAAIAAIVAGSPLLLIWLLPVHLVVPALSVASFIFACGAAIIAYRFGADHRAPGASAWDIAAAFAFIWIATGLMTSTKQLVRLFHYVGMAP